MSPVQLVLALAPEKKEVDVSAHLEVATQALWIAALCIVLFFVLRPELWRRIWFQRIDPRPAALTRIALGITVLWTFLDLCFLQGEWLFTDQGMLLTEQARKNYGGKLRTLWDPEEGFESWKSVLDVLTDRWTVLHIRSDPPFVYAMFGLLFASCFAMIIGWRTRITTVLTWLMVLQIYGYMPMYYAGGDTVLRTMMFCGMFVDWGKAYSVDAWRARRKAILGGAKQLPGLAKIPAWPQRFFMLQLACIYCATGLLKSGETWADGSALYYALNLDHFYRVPMHLLAAWLHKLYISRVMTWVVHWWEIFFPLALLGEALRGWDHDVERKTWTGVVPRWSLYTAIVVGVTYLVFHFGAVDPETEEPGLPTWVKTAPLFVLAGILYVERRFLKPADESGKGVLALLIRVTSWACLVGVAVVAGYIANLAIHYYYTPPKNAPAWLPDKELLQTLANVGAVVIPVAFVGGIMVARRWLPGTYLVIRDWLLGKRFWLVVGFGMHAGIELSMNVGTFVQVMVAVYPMWLWGKDVDALWRFLLWRAAKPGEAGRPPLPTKKLARVLARLAAPWQRLNYRVKPPAHVVVHGPSDAAIRRVALLRCWDLAERIEFELDPARSGETIALRDGSAKLLTGPSLARALISLLPGLWWLWPFSRFPGADRLALAILRQKV
jgi:hypothetical protein